MTKLVELRAGDAYLALAPELGGAIARLDVGEKPVLRPWSGALSHGPFALASNVLVPFSNRISNNGFMFENKCFKVYPNLIDEELPIHGDGFQRCWEVAIASPNACRLTLENGHIGPFNYRSVQDFNLTPDGLKIDLNLTNTGLLALPFGFGFHPWFPRNEDTRLQFHADNVWMQGENHLPIEQLETAQNPDWNYATSRPLPDDLVDNGWTGWTGAAHLRQGHQFTSVKITAARNLNCAIVYSTGTECDFVCFEPVSHPVDAYHLDGMPGLKILEPDACMATSMRFSWGNLG